MAQLLKQRTETLTPVQSCVIVKNMIRISISQICFIRNIFPEDCFSTKDYGGITIKQLEAADRDDQGNMRVKNRDAFLLTQWLEKGVFDAIELTYLQSLTFAVFSKNEATGKESLVETYQFVITYPDTNNGETTFSVNGQKASRENVKQQAITLVRSLIEFSSTLDQLPSDRWLTLRIQYYDERTPIDYEPEFFKPIAFDSMVFENDGRSKIIRVKLGKIESTAHMLHLKFTGLEPLLDTELCMIDPLCAQSYAGEEETKAGDIHMNKENIIRGEAINDDDEQTVDERQHPHIESVRTYLAANQTTTLAKCSKDLRMEQGVVRIALAELVKEGLVERKGTKYSISQPSETAYESQIINMEDAMLPPPATASVNATIAPTLFSQDSHAVDHKKRKWSVIEKPVHQQVKTLKK